MAINKSVNWLGQNMSGGQISSKYSGNISQTFYQTGSTFLHNALVTPNGCIKRRPGTRFVCPALGGKETKLFAANSIMVAISPEFMFFIYGNKPITMQRKDKPVITKDANNKYSVTNAYPSDVFFAEKGKEYGKQVYLSFADSANDNPVSIDDFFINRDDQQYDTFLRTPIDANNKMNITPDNPDYKLTGSGLLREYDWYRRNSEPTKNIFENPDNAKYVSTNQNLYTFPKSADLSSIDLSTAEPILKIRTSPNYVSGTANTEYRQHLDYIVKNGLNLYIPQFHNLAATASDAIELMNIELPTLKYPEVFKSEVKHDYRSLYLAQDIAHETYNPNFDSNGVIIGNYRDFVSSLGITVISGVDDIFNFKFLGSTIFQGRLTVAYANVSHYDSSVYIYFSRQNRHNDFTMTTGNTVQPVDPFFLQLDFGEFADMNILHEFANTLVIGTKNSIHALYSGSGVVNAVTLGQIAKISDIGTSNAKPALHNSNLYLIANNRKTILEVVKEPMSILLRCERVDTLSDANLVNGYITKLVSWVWDHQYLGALTSDGVFIKANLDTEVANFNTWSANKDTILDVEIMVVPDTEDILYFVINRDGETVIECMYNNQEINKYYHNYSTFRRRSIENETTNKMVDLIAPMYVRNGFYADMSITVKVDNKMGSVSIAGTNAVFTNILKEDIKDGDILLLRDASLIADGHDEVQQFLIVSYDNVSHIATIQNPHAIILHDNYDFKIKRQVFSNKDYPMLGLFEKREDIAVYADGISFQTSLYDDINETANTQFIHDNGDLVMNGFYEEVTIGLVYRFMYVSMPITDPKSATPHRPHTMNPVKVLVNFSYYLDFGTEPGLLNPLGVKTQQPVFGLQWIDLVVNNCSGSSPVSLILKCDMPAPLEIIAINLSYAG